MTDGKSVNFLATSHYSAEITQRVAGVKGVKGTREQEAQPVMCADSRTPISQQTPKSYIIITHITSCYLSSH